MYTFRLEYDDEDDILEVTWGPANREDIAGYELEDDIVLHTNRSLSKPVRLMLLSYQKLVELPTIELTNLLQMPQDKQDSIRRLLLQEPLNRFLTFDGDHSVKIADTMVRDLAA